MGGYQLLDGGIIHDLDTVEAYDVTTHSWATNIQPMPTARDSLCAATGSDGRIYAIGGSRLLGRSP